MFNSLIDYFGSFGLYISNRAFVKRSWNLRNDLLCAENMGFGCPLPIKGVNKTTRFFAQ
ncbi:hypothetical protein OBV_05710 [Oscillibacter valericigenes Sjm18-20]|nr:hypothetical protein OBV_05710 [Oscillibacter valericigenes Sjm18-20]